MGAGPSSGERPCFALFGVGDGGAGARADDSPVVRLIEPTPPGPPPKSEDQLRREAAVRDNALRDVERHTRSDQLTLVDQRTRFAAASQSVVAAHKLLEDRQTYAQKRSEALRQEALRLAREGRRDLATKRIRSRRLWEASARRIDGISYQLEAMCVNLEDSQLSFATIVPLKDLSGALGASLESLDTKKIDDLMELLAKQISDAFDIGKMLGDTSRLTDPSQLGGDDDALDQDETLSRELDAMLAQDEEDRRRREREKEEEEERKSAQARAAAFLQIANETRREQQRLADATVLSATPSPPPIPVLSPVPTRPAAAAPASVLPVGISLPDAPYVAKRGPPATREELLDLDEEEAAQYMPRVARAV
jgi:hypothetical protein